MDLGWDLCFARTFGCFWIGRCYLLVITDGYGVSKRERERDWWCALFSSSFFFFFSVFLVSRPPPVGVQYARDRVVLCACAVMLFSDFGGWGLRLEGLGLGCVACLYGGKGKVDGLGERGKKRYKARDTK